MKTHIYPYILLLILTGLMRSVSAQEFNYWLNEVGPQSSMLSGAVTAGVKDNSAIYYNPAGLAYVENSSLSFSSNGYSLGVLNIANGAGQNLDLKSFTFGAFSQIFSFVQKIPKLPISLTFALINTHYSEIKTDIKNDMFYDVIPSYEDNEYFIGTYRYYNKIREDWGGFGYGKRLRPNFGLGVSAFITYRYTNYFKSQTADVYPDDPNLTSYELLANSNFEEELNYNSYGLLFILGASWQFQKMKYGLSVTTPRINLGFVSTSNLKKSVTIENQISDTLNYRTTMWRSDVKSVYKSPLIIDLGIEFPLSGLTTLYGKLSFFSGIRTYKILATPQEDENLPEFIDKHFEGFTNMIISQKALANVSFAVQHLFSEKFKLLTGFRTDFNPINKKEINVFVDSYPGQTYWNIYHLTAGVFWFIEKFELSLGVDFGTGRNKNSQQFINLTEPTDENFLFGIPSKTSKVRYNQLNISVGFTYTFQKK